MVFYIGIKMYSVTANKTKNRLTIILNGFLSKEEAVDIQSVIIKEVSELSPGFDVINDISNFRLGLEETEIILKEIVEYLVEKKVNKIVRVVGSSRAGVLQFAQHTTRHSKYDPQFVPTMGEAEKFLDK